MTASPEPAPHCTVCGTAVAAGAPRCPACGLSRPAAAGARVLGRRGLWMIAAVLAAVYICVLLIVTAAK